MANTLVDRLAFELDRYGFAGVEHHTEVAANALEHNNDARELEAAGG